MSAIQDLKAEVENDPLARGYAGMDDAAVAADLNTVNRPATEPVSAVDQRMWLAQNGRHEKLFSGQTSGGAGNSDVMRGLCRSALLMATNDDEYKREDHKALLDGLVATGILEQTDADALDGQADITVSRADELGLSRVREGTVAQARRL